MNPATVIQALTAVAALASQVTPLILQLQSAMQSGDDAQLEALLARLQSANDALGQA